MNLCTANAYRYPHRYPLQPIDANPTSYYPHNPAYHSGCAPHPSNAAYPPVPACPPMTTPLQMALSPAPVNGNPSPNDAPQSPIQALGDLSDGRPAEISQDTTGHKRAHSAIESPSDSEDNGDEVEDIPITEDCDAIRRKINNLINSGEMKVTEFQRMCGINSNSYGRFMKLKGPYAGEMNQTYEAAFFLFKARKKIGVKEPTKKKVKKDEENKKLDVSGITLEGEDDEAVEVYDTCDDIRRKIAAYLREPNITQAAFLRSLAQMLPDPTIKLQSKQMKDFQTKKGPLAGNTSRIYYAAYVFFEKQRIQHGKPKSKKRKENEAVWGVDGGIRRDRPMDRYYSGPGMKAYMDQYGKVRVA